MVLQGNNKEKVLVICTQGGSDHTGTLGNGLTLDLGPARHVRNFQGFVRVLEWEVLSCICLWCVKVSISYHCQTVDSRAGSVPALEVSSSRFMFPMFRFLLDELNWVLDQQENNSRGKIERRK